MHHEHAPQLINQVFKFAALHAKKQEAYYRNQKVSLHAPQAKEKAFTFAALHAEKARYI